MPTPDIIQTSMSCTTLVMACICLNVTAHVSTMIFSAKIFHGGGGEFHSLKKMNLARGREAIGRPRKTDGPY